MKKTKAAGLLLMILGAGLLLSGCLIKNDETTNVYPTYSMLPFDQSTPTPPVQNPSGDTGISVGLVTAPAPEMTAPIQVVTQAPTVNQGSIAAHLVGDSSNATPTAPIQSKPTQTPTPKPTPTPTPNNVLREGATGDKVRELQKLLKNLGYYTGSADGDFGPATEKAVRAFQKRNGLTVDGIAGERTLALLRSGNAKKAPTPTPKVTPRATSRTTPRTYTASTPSTYRYLQLGSSGSDVKKLQQRLKDLGYFSGSVNGNYGTDTEDAVIDFQDRNGLWVDGVAGEDTQRMLFSSEALYK